MDKTSLRLMELQSMECDELAEWLIKHKIPQDVCEELKDQGVDGYVFMDLTEKDLKEMFPRKIGIVRRMLRIQKEEINATQGKLEMQSISIQSQLETQSTSKTTDIPLDDKTLPDISFTNTSSETLLTSSDTNYSPTHGVRTVTRRRKFKANNENSDIHKCSNFQTSTEVPHLVPENTESDISTDIQWIPQATSSVPEKYQSVDIENIPGVTNVIVADPNDNTNHDFHISEVNRMASDLKNIEIHKHTNLQGNHKAIISDPEKVDVIMLDCNELVTWLEMKKIFGPVESQTFKAKMVDGECFLNLTDNDIKSLIKPYGIVIKLRELREEMKIKHKDKYEHGDIASFNCEEFLIWMKTQNFSSQECQLFQDCQIDGEIFMKLTENDIKSIINKEESVLKLMEFQNQNKVTINSKNSGVHSSKLCGEQNSAVAPLNPLPDHIRQLFCRYIDMLGLTKMFPKKLGISDALLVRQETLENVQCTDQIELLPYLILQKIMMFDSKSRENLYKGDVYGGTGLENIEEIHPIDSFLALLHCCNNFLAQDLLTKLSTCQFAIPFLLPNPYDGSITFLLWGIRSIIRAWKSYDAEGTLISNECRIVDFKSPIISFFKIGKMQQSKSKIINIVISESKWDFFFHWNCEGGSSERLFVDGTTELCCYLPSGKKDANNFYSDIIIFSNLRGDARKHGRQMQFLQKISYMSFVLLAESEIDDEIIKLLQELAQVPGGIVLLFSDLGNNQSMQIKHSQILNGMQVIKLLGKNDARIRNEVRNEILKKLNVSDKRHFTKLSACADLAHKLGIKVDEDDQECIKGRTLATKVIEVIPSLYADKAKFDMLPLQGPDYWQKWATHDKESYRQLVTSVDIYNSVAERSKKDIRSKQFYKSQDLSPPMKSFLEGLMNMHGSIRLYFLHWLRIFLDDHSCKVLPSLHKAYQETRTKLLKAKAENKSLQDDTEIIKQLKEQLRSQNEQLVNASLGLEHFFREMGQIFEARMDPELKMISNKLNHEEVTSYPKVVAELMAEGYPVELMDGDASHVPITWVVAVLKQLRKIHSQKSSIYVVSVLGIQSTGKSTLLNTIFGLHFNVSAGRCTRGAYFQLLPLNQTLSNKIGANHIMIVDTEGLRAPELQYKESQRHDNELATFVIGLADLTIINIYGETPGELTDILQTAVHAFIRMKNVEMQLSCHFVHQNVTAVMADSKSKVGRQNFQDRLDLMTSTAAKVEKCEGKFRCFQDVIQFNDDKNVTLFPSLWKGDPPMAPVNTGYSVQALLLKQEIIATAQEKHTDCNFGNFELRVKRLWSAVLQEKFVFSFKNTLEVTAYNELDTKYGHWSWEFQHKSLEWQHQAGNEISSCDASTIESVVDECLAKATTEINGIYAKLNKELIEFFEKSERSETLAQWRKSTEIRLQRLCGDHKDEARKHCKIMKCYREGRVKIDTIQQTYQQQLQAHILSLASDAKQYNITAEQREKMFNTQWQKWMSDLSQNKKLVVYSTEDVIQKQIISTLEDQHHAYLHVIKEMLQIKPLTQRQTLKLEIEQEHLDSTRWYSNVKKFGKNLANKLHFTEPAKYAEVNDEDIRSARRQTSEFFNQVEEWMNKIISMFQDFNKSQISTLLLRLQQSIENFNNRKQHYSFTPHYQVQMAVTISGYAYTKFVAKVKDLKVENDPLEALKKLKPIFFRTFETQCSEASNDQMAAYNLCNIITNPIEKALIEKMQIEISHDMKHDNIVFRKKSFFKVHIMKELAVKKDFKLYKTFLTDITSSLKYWSKYYVHEFCKQTKKGNNHTNLYEIAMQNLNGIIDIITTAINCLNISDITENFEPVDNLLTVQDDDKPPTDGLTQCTDIKIWLGNFHKQIKATISIDLQEMITMVGVHSINNLDFFVKQLIKSLKNEANSILKKFENVPEALKVITESLESPHTELFKSLIGCKEQCPFCKEQCEDTNENHLTGDEPRPHYTEVHRPRCLGKYVHVKDNTLVLEICTKAIETDATFRNEDTKNEPFPYKDYKDKYPNWLISTESPKTGPKYWEWFIATFNSDIIIWNDAASTPMKHLGWDKITEEDAVSNLYQAYKLDTKPL